jgi:hypothetical protein
MGTRRDWLAFVLAGSLFIGCERHEEDESGTGSRECVEVFYNALIQQDWMRAYATLDPGNQKADSLQQFSRLAHSYRRNLGFEPETLHIQSCQERGQEAIAHVVLTGRDGDRERRYKDAVTLRRYDAGWRIVLPKNFGRQNKR